MTLKNAMTVMYPLQEQDDNTELLYSLRSLEQFYPGDYEVVIVGSKLPGWITGITQIDLPDIRGRKQLTIKSKILAALAYTPEIFFMNDDVFLTKDTIAEDHPYYFYGDLKHYTEGGARPLWDRLTEYNLPTKHFDLHYPLVYRRDLFVEAVEKFQPDTIVKSMYCNYHMIKGYQFYDCKFVRQERDMVMRDFAKSRPAFSTGVFSLKNAVPFLRDLYPNKSKYEI